ncbi:MAG: sigma-70 family RNA polymerase sigma factor [Kiritimatiellaeota bacterium]|nr:sigma-70 family RNA polymerase sigma factor [Kiritimatiellota bacterium]
MTTTAARPESDEELVRRYQRTGALDAADELIRRHTPATRRMIRHMLLCDTDADDLTQEVFIRAFHALPRFNGRAHFTTWLYRIALNTARTYIARKKKTPVLFTENPPDRPESATYGPERRMLNHELDARISAALNRLKPKLRAAIVLTMIEGYPPAEAARIESCLTATFYWRLHQARKILQEALRPYLDDDDV